MKILELFSGYGTASFALKRLNIEYELVGYSDIDKYANKVFKQNHCPNDIEDKLRFGDVRLINPNNLPDFDLLTAGFPCQSFSIAGKGLGELDPRGTLFYEIIRIAEVKKPRYMLLENVKGLTNKNHKSTFDKILSELNRIGYKVHWKILNTKDYGIPQNRERVWFVCFREQEDYDKFQFPEKEELKIFIKDILEEQVDKKYYLSEKLQERFKNYLEEKERKKINKNTKTRDINKAIEYALNKSKEEKCPIQLDLYHLLYGEIRPLSTYVPQNSKIHRCLQAGEPKEILIYDVYNNSIPKNQEISTTLRTNFNNRNVQIITGLQKHQSIKDNGISNSLPSAMGEGGGHIPIIMGTVTTAVGRSGHSKEELGYIENNMKNGQIRKLTPKECFRLQGFINDEVNLDGISDTQKYKLAGNGQSVNVVEKIFRQMFKVENYKNLVCSLEHTKD